MTQNELDRAVGVIEESPLCDPQDTIQRLHRMVEERNHKIVNLETGWRRCEGCPWLIKYEGKGEKKQWTNLPIQEWTSSKIPPYKGEKEPDDRIAESLGDNAPRVIIWLFSGITIGMVITWIIWAFTE